MQSTPVPYKKKVRETKKQSFKNNIATMEQANSFSMVAIILLVLMIKLTSNFLYYY
jgi:hypothetical protein